MPLFSWNTLHVLEVTPAIGIEVRLCFVLAVDALPAYSLRTHYVLTTYSLRAHYILATYSLRTYYAANVLVASR